MEIKVKSTHVIKDGNRKDGTPYKWVSVMADDGSEKGTEYTTFDSSVLKLGPGSVIEINPDTKEGKLSFKKVVKVVSEIPVQQAPAPAASVVTPKNDMSKEDWAERDRIERASIEVQVAYKGVVDLIKEPNAWKVRGFESLVRKSFDWALEKLGGAVASTPASEPAKPKSNADADFDKLQSGSQKQPQKPFTLGAVLTWCQSHGKEYTRDWFFKNISLREDQLLSNPANLERAVGDIITKKPDWVWQ
ncbi:MAG: hypothetical protein PHG35_03420 [Dehalococcoidales bacterium]|nr:hypothetical protein [Dehalococcoidales bacterium]